MVVARDQTPSIVFSGATLNSSYEEGSEVPVMTAIRQIERPYTADDLATMPDDGRRYEVIGGELVVSPSPTTRHQRVSFRLSRLIADFLERTQAGEAFTAPLDIVLGIHDILQPDIVVVLKENSHRISESGVEGPPDLVVEIVSPSTVRTDRIRKSATYATFGVPEYWIVDPDSETILVQTLVDGQFQPVISDDGIVRSTHVAGLQIDASSIFTVPDWLANR